VRVKLTWKLAFSYLALVLLALAAADFYAARALRQAYLRATLEQLDSLSRVIANRPPPLDSSSALAAWTVWAARGGARVTVIASDGGVLADSAHNPATMENHAGRPEVREAMAAGQGSSIRHSATLDRDLVYLATRYERPGGPPAVIRLALPVAHINEALAEIRRRLWGISLLILAVGAAVSFFFSRSFAARVRRLKDFSVRVSRGDFRELEIGAVRDELDELSVAFNRTAAQLGETIRSLADERNRTAAIVASMAEGVAVIDPGERLRFANPAFGRLIGSEPERLVGRTLVEVARQPELAELVRQALAGTATEPREITLLGQGERQCTAAAAPVRGAGAAGAVLVLHDVTELRRLERVRRDFIANVSHEFRTPLTAIQGFAETLLGGALDDRENSRRFLSIIRNHAARLSRLTERLLRLSRIEAGKLEIESRPVRVADFVEPCLEAARLRAQERRLALEVDCPPDLPLIEGDRERLQEVVENLLDNALLYTPEGGRIGLRARAGDGQVVVTVSDTGMGIPQTEQERVFERFYRVEEARAHAPGGVGLGLAIARHIVEAHGGRIWVDSAVGRGSEFHFSVPQAA
jgi:two-component system, OmpR family, phosphate regulon sensor histidine kinase PhoR